MWANYVLFFIAIFILAIAIFGYYSVAKGHFTFIVIYILVLTFSSFACLVTGLGMLIKTSSIKDIVSKDWVNIEHRLKEAGYHIEESTFANFLEVNMKFAGLFVIVFCLFLIVGLIPAVYFSISLKRRKHGGVFTNNMGLSPIKFTNDNFSPKLKLQMSP